MERMASHSYCKEVAWGMERAGYHELCLTFWIGCQTADGSSLVSTWAFVILFAHSFLICDQMIILISISLFAFNSFCKIAEV